MPPIGSDEFNSAAARLAARRERAERRARYRGRWWFPLLLLLVGLTGCWNVLQSDQWFAEKLIWPTTGAQFVEVGPIPDDPKATGGALVIVAAGLNQKSGTRVATALMPALATDRARVFSLVYGSGINDQDLLDKYDALITRVQPRQVSFFGSSMGGDVVLGLAAHAQQLRTDYVATLLAARPAATTTPRWGAADAGSGASTGANGVTTEANGVATEANGVTTEPHGIANGTGNLGTLFGLLTATPGTAANVDGAGSDGSGADGSGADGSGADGAGASATGPADAQAAGMLQIRGSLTASDTAAASAEPVVAPSPRLGTIFLDCSPLGAQDVRNSSRTRADALTAVMEATGTEGGVAVRMTAEVLGQQEQWSSGRFPFLQVRNDDLLFKFKQVWREKISSPGISTGLIKDQYGVIRRTDIDDIVDELGPGTQIVYFLPTDRLDDRTVKVEQVEQTLQELAVAQHLDVRIIEIPGGSHASAADNTDAYLTAMATIRTGQT